MIRILIADDHAIVRRVLRQLLANETDMEVLGEAKNSQELLSLARCHACDLIVLDISMPGRNGLDILKELRQEFPETAVLILSMYPENQFAARAFREGAVGYVMKEKAPADLISAIRMVVPRGAMSAHPSTRGWSSISPPTGRRHRTSPCPHGNFRSCA